MHTHKDIEAFHRALHSHYKSRNVPLTEKRFYEELCNKFPVFKKPQLARKVSRCASGLARSPRQQGYPKSPSDKKQFQVKLNNWYVNRYVILYGPLICKECGADDGPIFSKFRNSNHTKSITNLYTYCSDSCSKKNDVARSRREATCLAKYGVRNVTYSKELRANASDWMLCPDRLELRQARTEATLIRKYGSIEKATASRMARTRVTNFKKYGGPAPTNCPTVLKKRDAAYFEKHGVRNPSQNPKVMAKIVKARGKGRPRFSATFNDYVFSGLQGAESECIELLISKGVKPVNIQVFKKGVPYTFYNTSRVYFPDLYVTNPSGKAWLLEVKSTYTAGLTASFGKTSDGYAHYSKLRAKFKGALLLGYNIALVIPYRGRLFFWEGPLPTLNKLRNVFNLWRSAF